jgi:hypothetical protein
LPTIPFTESTQAMYGIPVTLFAVIPVILPSALLHFEALTKMPFVLR